MRTEAFLSFHKNLLVHVHMYEIFFLRRIIISSTETSGKPKSNKAEQHRIPSSRFINSCRWFSSAHDQTMPFSHERNLESLSAIIKSSSLLLLPSSNEIFLSIKTHLSTRATKREKMWRKFSFSFSPPEFSSPLTIFSFRMRYRIKDMSNNGQTLTIYNATRNIFRKIPIKAN